MKPPRFKMMKVKDLYRQLEDRQFAREFGDASQNSLAHNDYPSGGINGTIQGFMMKSRDK